MSSDEDNICPIFLTPELGTPHGTAKTQAETTHTQPARNLSLPSAFLPVSRLVEVHTPDPCHFTNSHMRGTVAQYAWPMPHISLSASMRADCMRHAAAAPSRLCGALSAKYASGHNSTSHGSMTSSTSRAPAHDFARARINGGQTPPHQWHISHVNFTSAIHTPQGLAQRPSRLRKPPPLFTAICVRRAESPASQQAFRCHLTQLLLLL